ncbi:MAG: hypothetical protein HYV33_00495 [Candidatus Kerfeldbacteria bacterium]|nr:hypothetical protein [Candidatus Kerfeldbacteria bacterium]
MADDLRGKTLQWAYWYNTHHSLLRRLGYGLTIVIVSGIWLVVLGYIIQWARWYRATQFTYQSISQISAVFDATERPQPLNSITVDVVPVTEGHYDMYALVDNPNQFYGARFNYSFTAAGQVYNYTTGFIMPATQAWLMVGNITIPADTTPTFTIDTVAWQRLSGKKPAIDFMVKDTSLTTTDASTAGSDLVTTISQFQGVVTNTSAYGFRQVLITVIIKAETTDAILGIRQLTLNNLAALAEQSITVNWSRRFAFGSRTDVVVTTDYLATDNLILPGDQ